MKCIDGEDGENSFFRILLYFCDGLFYKWQFIGAFKCPSHEKRLQVRPA
jgi:hypothetical protein